VTTEIAARSQTKGSPDGRWDTSGLTVALTGASGFLGRHVEARLVASGAMVVRVLGDVRAALHVVPERFDVLCHLAGRAGGAFASAPDEGVAVNVNGTLNALLLARRGGARFVFASTCAVYRPAHVALDERAPLGPTDVYGFSKQLAEGLCRDVASYHSMTVTVLRIFNPYGPGQEPGYLVPDVCAALARGEVPAVRRPRDVRDFVAVADVAEVVRRACVLGDGFHVLNVGSGIPMRVDDLVELAARLAGGPTQGDAPDGAGDPIGRCADLSQVRATLDWEPLVPLADGLKALLGAGAVAAVPRREGFRHGASLETPSA